MARHAAPAILAALLFAAPPAGVAAAQRHHHHRHRHAAAPAAPAQGYGYGRAYDPTPTCRYPDGTPYDPDIIGGANHVGDGGPAVNLGGFNPCGY